MAAPPPQELPEELVEEILLLLPPDEPACLVRASLVCKTWSGIVSHRAFRGRLHALHRAPPVLGFLHNWNDEVIPRFIPTTASSFSLDAPHRHFWRAIDCRHGRALFLSDPEDDAMQELLLWEPITGFGQRVPVPEAYEMTIFQPSAAVLCAAEGCDHRDCLGGPFCLVFVFSVEDLDTDEEEYITSACVYSSETGAWGELTSMHVEFLIDYTYYSSVLVLRSMVYFMGTCGSILEYDLARPHDLNVFEPPDSDLPYSERFNLILMEDGALGVSQSLDSHLKFWSREVATNETDDDRWVLIRVIELENLLPVRALARAEYNLLVLGFAEGANVIFVNTVAGLFTIELHSERVRKVCDDHGFCNLVPVVGFYTPRSRLEPCRAERHHDLMPPLNITEEVGGEEDKKLQRVRKLFDKWCKDIEEGGFGKTTDFSSQTLEFRVPLPPEQASTFYRYGCAFLCKVIKATDHSRNGSKSSSNEESIKSTATASKDDTEASEAFGSNVEQASAEKIDSEEGKNFNGKYQEDGNVAGGGDDSDLDLASKMLNVARAIVTESSGMTMEKFNIFRALAEVCKKREDWDNTIGYYFKALAILEHLVRPDHIRIVNLNDRICVAFELASKVGDAITYCAKAISLCKSRIQNLKNAKEGLLADNDVYTSAAEGSSGIRSPEDEISLLTGTLARLQKKLEALEQAMSTSSSGVDRTVKRVVSMSSQEHNVKNAVARTTSLTSSQMAGSNHSFRSPTMSTAAATGGIGSGVTYFGIFSTGMKQLMRSMSLLQTFLQRMIHHP